ncbi:hypothetical protein A2363_01455 [Candidatus Gottesmanbacteria bacterium RIFOXYB1_FULL_47_11]|uniref:HAD family hydrolase n=1 Tax=Candidatus Gottesmanbacteria bacterium RIFOXYB1_FULL_47_11 TaxID=1798401 RepID=A0A1F6BF34_9BACT|nr:MAG: hypothetical protein A2363_01455 [Candidatus Gottesmanbacteria bacterium RIFOXYB1_FULL_47_11]
MKLESIRVLIWDFDGTLYRPNTELFAAVREAEYQAIMEHTGWTREKAMEEFHKLHRVTIQSATAVIAKLCNMSIGQAAVESEKRFDRRKYLHRDEKLIDLFAKLTKFRHFTLANGVKQYHVETLKLLGVPPETFEEMVTSETVGVTKPDDKGFRYIMKKTGLPPEAHLMIGDRELVDLAPAKNLGMHTCLVWSDKKSTIADATLLTVYDVAAMLQ